MKTKSCERDGCDNPIPPERLKKHLVQRFCSRQCAQLTMAEERKANGFYQKFSQLGNAAQNKLAQKRGERPGRANRSASMKRHNELHPRTGPHKKRSKNS